MIDKLDLKIDWMDEERFDKIVQSKINEIIDKVNSMEESSHVKLDSDDKPKFETYYCPKCNEYVYSKDFEQEHFCNGKCYYKPKEENQKSLLEQAREIKLTIPFATNSNTPYYYQEDVKEKIDLYEQYAKEAEEKIKELNINRELYKNIMKENSITIGKLQQDVEQLKQNKIEDNIECKKCIDCKILKEYKLTGQIGLPDECLKCRSRN